ncbi:hypothetical protein [Deinococcus apachensis]|uniref:hypothetical protein n=1 Tax=Deinococcus apachensis TaxID=309886 RepID=UPI000374F1AE|nr:hypothetical protein [Deinococcus apachensis]
MQTYGIYAVKVKGINVKDDKDNGWVADVKWAFMAGVTGERKFTLEHMPVLKGAAAENGRIKLEVTPMLDGQPLPAVYLPVHLRGNITIGDDGSVNCTTRVTFDELETAGLGVDSILNSVNCLECRVSDQPTLEEQIQQELRAEKQLQQDVKDLLAEAAPLLNPPALSQVSEVPGHETAEQFLARATFGQLSTLLQAIGYDPTDWDDPKSSDDQDAAEWRELLLKDWDRVVASGALEGMYEVEEDLPFPPSSTDSGTQPSA